MKTPLASRVPGTPSTPLPPHAGHRARLRTRFQRGGLANMLDYEVLELVLTLLIPRRDVKPLAKRLLDAFESVSAVLEAPPEKLLAVEGVGETTATNLRLLHELFLYSLEEKCRQAGNLLTETGAMYDFVRMKMGARAHESYMMLYLDSGNRLIDFRLVAEGAVDHVYAYVRNAAEYALELHAVGAVMVHNHPSGICEPSNEDINATREMTAALHTVGVKLLDHLIVSPEGCFSFANHKLMHDTPTPQPPEKEKEHGK